MVVIRNAKGDDASAISRLLTLLHDDPSITFDPQRIRQESKQFVAEKDGRTVGFVLVTLTDYGFSSYGMIEEFIVDTEQRGSGVGQQLMDACLNWLASERAEVAFVSAGDVSAEAFYQHLGFRNCTGPWLYAVPKPEAQ